MHYAEIDNSNTVLRVIVCDSKEWCEANLGGTWVRTYYNTSGKNYAGQGYIYYPDKENFSAPSPFPSWILDDSLTWQPPTPYPSDGNMYSWNEEVLIWEPITDGNL